MNDYIAKQATTGAEQDVAHGLTVALTHAEENFLPAPGAALGALVGTLAAAGAPAYGAVAVTPAAGAVGLHILRGLPEKSTLTCIDPEAEHQSAAREAFRVAGFAPSRARFLTARPLDVMSRLAPASYHLVYADVAPVELSSLVTAAWPLLAPGGTLVIAGSLLDGTVADPTRRDRDTEAARAAEGDVDKLGESEGAVVTRLPLDGGVTLVTRR
ncbi:Predicted O-methyltransferase YrrM [Corynebacterium timonense]|uniref:Predicted O-methyltransferase YrrM n=2 Tax=Corynebacterium timonense TaxID=441500 RepID=A0A1H1QDR5_9CORY|nr:Predicted O-methyltransferase YrrM [Corynebacterium timonense]